MAARWLVGADHRWSLPVTLLATPALLLFFCRYYWSSVGAGRTPRIGRQCIYRRAGTYLSGTPCKSNGGGLADVSFFSPAYRVPPDSGGWLLRHWLMELPGKAAPCLLVTGYICQVLLSDAPRNITLLS